MIMGIRSDQTNRKRLFEFDDKTISTRMKMADEGFFVFHPLIATSFVLIIMSNHQIRFTNPNRRSQSCRVTRKYYQSHSFFYNVFICILRCSGRNSPRYC